MRTSAMRSSIALWAALAVMGGSARAQNPPDFSKVEIKTIKTNGNVYVLEGQGGRIGFLAGPDGIFMVDTQFAPLSDKIVAAIRQVSSGPIRFVINTHVHGDHTGGDANFAKLGAVIFSRDELREKMVHPAPGANGTTPPAAPAAALPVITYPYGGHLTFHMNGEEIEVYPLPPGHTGGDSFVRFKNADVIMTGDYYRALGYTFIDKPNGGAFKTVPDGLAFMISLAGPNTTVVPGHGPIGNRTTLMAHRDMLFVLRDRIAKLVQEGKTLDQVLAAKVTSDYDPGVPDPSTAEPFVRAVYAELSAAK